MNRTVDAVLMASGFSSRFGKGDKLLQPFGGRPMAERTLKLVCESGLFGVVRFIYSQPEVGLLASNYPVEAILNKNPGRGACESVRLGVLPSSADYYMFLPCDQPFLDAETLETVINSRHTGRITVPAFGGMPGSPALFSSAYREELLNLADHQNARAIRDRHPEQVTLVEIKSRLPLIDVDTREELYELERRVFYT